MDTFSEKTEQFLKSGTDQVSRSLAIAVIDCVGGEQAFISGNRDGIENATEFFEQNIGEINVCLNKMTADLGVDSAATLILSTGHLQKTSTKKEVLDVLNGQKTANYEAISGAVTTLIVSDVEMSYTAFLEIADEDSYFVDGEEIDGFDDDY